ncbi:hypothetical protein [Breoghania sp.]|uniref:helix-turn-helix transcriptional regulator n=1 Tax=Breoghania sp. TaxID=2065378 RepID=UPI002AA8DEC4|nr:hypothetical protein [Breoghania sp.]
MSLQTPSRTYTRTQLCEALGVGESNFDRRRQQLENADFPKRLPGLARWSRAAVDAWIAANGDAELMREILVGPEPEVLSNVAASDTIAKRYGGMAR